MGVAVSVLATVAAVAVIVNLTHPELFQRENAAEMEASYVVAMNTPEVASAQDDLAKARTAQQKASRRRQEARKLRNSAAKLEQEAKDLLQQDWGPRPAHLPTSLNSIGFVGRGGVGKSSLWNAFVGYALHRFTPDPAAHRESLPHAVVGPTETTREVQSFQVPGTVLNLVDNPGHGSLSFRSSNYIRSFGIAYFLQILYVYSGRLQVIDAMLLLHFIIYRIPFVVVRQMFRSDLESFASKLFHEQNPNYHELFDNDGRKDEFVRARIHDPDFIQQCKEELHKELQRNWVELVEQSPSRHVQQNSNQYRNMSLTLFCVDSKSPEAYDTEALFEHINGRAQTLQGEADSVSESEFVNQDHWIDDV